MATYAARRLGEMAANSADIVAIELLAAAQGIDFLAPLTTSPALLPAHRGIRARVAHLDDDREFAPDIAAAAALVRDGHFRGLVPELALGAP